MIIGRVARGISDHFPARASEWALAWMMLLWGVFVLKPDELFVYSPTYAQMRGIASEYWWGITTVGVGSLRLVALVVNGTFVDTWWGRWSPYVRAVMSFAACFLWASISMGIAASDFWGTSLAVYPLLFALDAWNCHRAAGDAGEIEGARGNGS